MRIETPFETPRRGKRLGWTPGGAPLPPPQTFYRVLHRALSPKRDPSYARPAIKDVLKRVIPKISEPAVKTSTPTNDFNKPNPESEPFYPHQRALKALKISTHQEQRPKYTFAMPAVKPFQGLLAMHSLKFYDRLISMLIAEISSG